jgi:ribosomal protein S18 acetylase RimI-like enzyme
VSDGCQEDNIIIRVATGDDFEFSFEVKKAAFGEYIEATFGWDDDEQRRVHERRFAEQEFRIVEYRGLDVGVMAIATEPDSFVINQLFLLPEYQSRGIGARCLQLAVEEAASKNLPLIRLKCRKNNLRALSFYERESFTRYGENETHFFFEKLAK